MSNIKKTTLVKLPKFTLKSPPKACPMPLFPTMGALQDVIDLAESNLPITNKNDMLAILGAYHNTLLKELNKE